MAELNHHVLPLANYIAPRLHPRACSTQRPLEHHAFPSNAVNSGHNGAYPTPESQQQPPPLRPPYTSSLEGYSSYSNAVKNGHLRTDRIYLPSQTQQQQRNPLHFHLQNGPPPTMHPALRASRTQLFSFPSKRSVWR